MHARAIGLVLFSSFLLLAACSDDRPARDDDDDDDTQMDGGVLQDGGGGGGPDAGGAGGGGAGGADAGAVPCGDGVLPVDEVTGTHGIAIGPDGTLYYSQDGAVGRVAPGESVNNAWVDLPGTGATTGLALDAKASTLYVASPSNAAIYAIDLSAAAPSATLLYTGAQAPDGLTVGPDGAVYYSDSGEGRVYRVDPGSGARAEVTATPLPMAKGILFESATSLLVVGYDNGGGLWRLTLDAQSTETGRKLLYFMGTLPHPDGIGRDSLGRVWYTADGLGYVGADFSQGYHVLEVPGAGDIAFGKGALLCTDVYAASSGKLARYNADAPGMP